jgi:Do/DeqQ family serine protease
MKKIINTFIIAAIGGLFSLGIYHFAVPRESVVKVAQPTDGQVRKVTYTGLGEQMAVDFTAAAELTVNSVVHVKTESLNEAYNSYHNDPFYQFFYGLGRTPHKPRPVMSAGSGVIVSHDGYIVTNNHVVDRADKIEVVLNNNETFEAKVVGTDPTTDLALLQIESDDPLPYVPYGNSDETRVGEWVLAVGNPFNLTSTVTAGIVSAKGRNINVLGSDPRTGMSSIESFIQTDAAVNPGNSGGALVNTRGELIGINSAIKSATGSYIGYSFAIPSNIVSKVVRDLKEFGTVQRAFIGINIRNIDKRLAEEEGLKSLQGVFVAGTMERGAAEEAGIRKGDVITRIGSIEVNNVPELQEQVSQFRPGEELLVTVQRDDEEIEKKLVLKNFEGNTKLIKKEKIEKLDLLGASFEPVSDEEKNKLKIKNGIKVTNLWNGKLSKAGVAKGFIIVRIDNEAVDSVEDLGRILEDKRGGVLFEGIYPNGRAMYYGLGL